MSFPLAIIWTLLTLPLSLQADEQQHICHSMEIHSVEDLKKLQKCSIIVGHLEIANFEFPPDAGANYSVAVSEITDYLLVHRVHGLQSLQQLLPQLVLIRGVELLFDRYAFVVYENLDLEELALISLLRIQQGSVRIEANPVLCFVETVNWLYLLKNISRQHFMFSNNRKHCPLCINSSADLEPENDYDTEHCWNLQSYQRKIVGRRSICPVKCESGICDSFGRCCSADCLSGCLGVGCSLCANYVNKDTCMDSCSIPFHQLNKRECVLKSICRKHGFIPHAFQCLEHCPDNYQPKNNSNGLFDCEPNCSGKFVINTLEDLHKLADCSIINGSLIIQLTHVKSQIIADLERTFLGLTEITGYLKIINSPQLVSLNFLKSLHTIRGDELIDKKYAFYVVDNHHLEEIWAKNQKVSIYKGQIYFHLNPRLCHHKILELSESLKSAAKISIHDASPNSNGERIICGTNVRTLVAAVEDLSATAAVIKVETFSSDDINVLIGYSYHYKEAPERNVTMYDGRHGCGHDRWFMDISRNQNIRHIISNLKPNTQYAYFIKTISYTDYHYQMDAYSEIQYFRTMPSKPDAISKIFTSPLSTTEMTVHWWPPRISKGHIIKYLLTHEAIINSNTSSTENYVFQGHTTNTIDTNCICSLPDPYFSGPVPDDENYYNKEQIIYDEALGNLVYVTQNKTNQGATRDKEAAREAYVKYIELKEKKAHDLQDTGTTDFQLEKPKPICSIQNPSKEFQKNNNCVELEKYDGIVLPGHQHSFILRNLQPTVTYRISVRTCVEGLDNGCGPAKSVTAVTVTKDVEEFLKEFQSSIKVEMKT